MAKMKTLDEAMLLLQRIHGSVEKYAHGGQARSAGVDRSCMNLRRTLPVVRRRT